MRLYANIPDDVTSRELAVVVRLLGIRLVAQPDGSVVGIPINPERRGSQSIERIRRRQPSGRFPGPEAA